jgi:hypothetical protein
MHDAPLDMVFARFPDVSKTPVLVDRVSSKRLTCQGMENMDVFYTSSFPEAEDSKRLDPGQAQRAEEKQKREYREKIGIRESKTRLTQGDRRN